MQLNSFTRVLCLSYMVYLGADHCEHRCTLFALPVNSHGFSLHKGAFQDAISLQPSLLPTSCICGKSFTVDHACPELSNWRFPNYTS